MPQPALEQGRVSDGGTALLQAANAVHLDGFEKHEEKTGAKIALRALKEPLRQIDHNAGLEGSVIVNDLRIPSGSADSPPRAPHRGSRCDTRS